MLKKVVTSGFLLVALAGVLLAGHADSEGLSAARLGVLYNLDDAASRQIALYYAAQRKVPAENVFGIHLPDVTVMTPEALRVDLSTPS